MSETKTTYSTENHLRFSVDSRDVDEARTLPGAYVFHTEEFRQCYHADQHLNGGMH